jgi:hypothetical protein
MYYFDNFATMQLQIPISIRAMMRVFGCARDRDRVTNAPAHGFEPSDNHEHHPALDDDIGRGLLL